MDGNRTELAMSSWPGEGVVSIRFKRPFCLLLHMLELPHIITLN